MLEPLAWPRADARVARTHAGAPLPVIALAKDWHEDPTSNHHVLRELARTRRVLWLNSLGTRPPSLASGRDLSKIKRKLVEVARGPQNVENDLWVATPLVLPLPYSAAAGAFNRQLLRATIKAMRLRLGIDRFQLWTFLPTTAPYVGSLGEELAVYYCVDEWSLFSYLDREHIVAAERALLAKVDAVFAVNHALADAKRRVNGATFVSPHGVDHALFARALDDATPVPGDLASIRGPRIGFYGTLRDWVDFDLIAHIARARPQWSIVLIGQQLADIAALAGLPNVHLLGQRPHRELPAYCKGFDVGIIPYRIDARMSFVNPLKLREYLSAGLPVVSTAVPEVERYSGMCRIASTPNAFVAALDAALHEGSPTARGQRSTAMKNETWSARVAEVVNHVEDIAERKRQR
ncbi:MAG: glycosyltransferase [Kofleriaceae bacterium]|nr:glycosyltransferase [Kofleriaceae bacterium]